MSITEDLWYWSKVAAIRGVGFAAANPLETLGATVTIANPRLRVAAYRLGKMMLRGMLRDAYAGWQIIAEEVLRPAVKDVAPIAKKIGQQIARSGQHAGAAASASIAEAIAAPFVGGALAFWLLGGIIVQSLSTVQDEVNGVIDPTSSQNYGFL